MKLVCSLLMVLSVLGCGGGGGAQDPVCEPGEVRCSEDGSTVEACNADGSGYEVLSLCEGGRTCSQGLCGCGDGKVPGAGGCITPADVICPEGFVASGAGEYGCRGSMMECDAPGVDVVAGCIVPGVGACASGFEADLTTGACVPVFAACDDQSESAVGTECLNAGHSASCTDGFPALPDGASGQVLYVDNSAPDGGTGTEAAPFRQIGEALETADSTSWILVAPGVYAGGLVITSDKHILGACPETTVIEASPVPAAIGESTSPAVIRLEPSSVLELSGVTVRDTAASPDLASAGVVCESGSELAVFNSIFKDVAGAGVFHEGSGSLYVDGTTFNEVVTYKGDGGLAGAGNGVRHIGPGAVAVRNSRFFKTQGADVRITGSCPIVERNWFEGRGVYGGEKPKGVWVESCSAQDLTSGAHVKENVMMEKMTHAVEASDSMISISNNRIDTLVTDHEDLEGTAIVVSTSTAEVTGNYLTKTQEGAIKLSDTSGSVAHNVIDEVVPSDPGLRGGEGILVDGCAGCELSIEHNTIGKAVRNGILISKSQTILVRNNIIMLTQDSQLSGFEAGAGVNVVQGSTVDVEGNVLLGNSGFGIRWDKSTGSITGNYVSQVTERSEGGCTAGILVKESNLNQGIVQNRIEQVQGVGLAVVGGKGIGIENNRVLTSTGGKRSAGVGIWLSDADNPVTGNWVSGAKAAGLVYSDSVGLVEGNLIETSGGPSGAGLVVQLVDNPPVELVGNTVLGCIARGIASIDSSAAFRKNSVIDTTRADGLLGVGVWFQGEGEAEFRGGAVYNASVGGFVFSEVSSVTVSSTLVAGVLSGLLEKEGEEFGDGFVVGMDSSATILYNRIQNNDKSAIFVGKGGSALISFNEFIGAYEWAVEVALGSGDSQDNVSSGFGNEFTNTESVRSLPSVAPLAAIEACSEPW